MTCDECRARLSAYLDGEAGRDEDAIRGHVGSCERCGSDLEALRGVSRRLRGVEGGPATLVEDIRRRISRRGAAVPRFAAAAVVLAALLWTGVLLTDRRKDVGLSSLAPLSETERRVLYGDPPRRDEWMIIVLTGGKPR